jgi:precorrin-8X/cobalt-precorrin-8 methylmutase
MNRHGILILGHGTPSDEGTRAFLEIVRLVESMAGETPVAAGFMEFASPNIAEGMAALHERGVARIAAVPVFLSGAGHTADDIPEGVGAANTRFRDLQVHITAHVGGHPKIAELSALRHREAIAGRAEVPPEETVAVLAAHGSPEPEAFEELENFARARERLTPGIRILPCFSQMGAPLLKDVLPALVAGREQKPSPPAPLPKGEGIKRIVVQPHFLLQGRLVEAIARTTSAAAQQHADIEWIIASPLGSHRLLAEAVLELGMSER